FDSQIRTERGGAAAPGQRGDCQPAPPLSAQSVQSAHSAENMPATMIAGSPSIEGAFVHFNSRSKLHSGAATVPGNANSNLRNARQPADRSEPIGRLDAPCFSTAEFGHRTSSP